ncbi:MAG: hypothetical protein HON90_02485 [Halobacteriovoraceae bacterium]|jgi:hypothetical protein|nr:hypothetical protein [Halobacteriovoraceae bacterium]
MKIQKIPFILATLTMVGGIFIAILFGVNESYFKNKISQDLQKNQKISQMADDSLREKKLKAEASKNWRYYQRFHFHATAIGSMAMVILLLLQFVQAPLKLVTVTSFMISVGGFLYPFVWLFAAIYGPEMGRHEAKESFAFFAYGGGVFLIGLLLTTYQIIRYPLTIKK